MLTKELKENVNKSKQIPGRKMSHLAPCSRRVKSVPVGRVEIASRQTGIMHVSKHLSKHLHSSFKPLVFGVDIRTSGTKGLNVSFVNTTRPSQLLSEVTGKRTTKRKIRKVFIKKMAFVFVRMNLSQQTFLLFLIYVFFFDSGNVTLTFI